MKITRLCFLVVCSFVAGCASGKAGGGSGVVATAPPEIVVQPVNQSVPMGLTANFSIAANGWPMTFQWMKNGVAIPGATSESYTTPATAFTDSGSAFSVTITNSLGTVTSTAATLTVTGRAPAQGDLRFQQVDSASTVNDLTAGGEDTELGGAPPGGGGIFELYFGDSIGTPLSVGPGCLPGGEPIGSCLWNLSSSPLPIGMGGLTTYYEYFPLSELATELSTFNASNAVVTGLDVEPPSDGFAASWVQPSTPAYANDDDTWGSSNGTFNTAMTTASPSSFQDSASQDGTNSRVITAVSWNNGQITYLSSGWSKDTTTVYEVQTATATFSTISTVAQQLATDGYIITAVGGTATNGLLLVGTRVQGDTVARPMLVEDIQNGGSLSKIANGGYAVVGFLINQDVSSGALLNYIWIGER